MRIKLTLGYDGTNFCGWQVQPNGTSVQGELETAVFKVTGEKVRITGIKPIAMANGQNFMILEKSKSDMTTAAARPRRHCIPRTEKRSPWLALRQTL